MSRALGDILASGHMSSDEGAVFFRSLADNLEADPDMRVAFTLEWWRVPNFPPAAGDTP